MRPLYLKGAGIQVTQDGPALKITQAGHADGWFPLQRVSRVISSPRVHWTTEALIACARTGISISFQDDDGGVVARLVGQPGEREEIRQRLADFLLRARWQEAYQQWLTAMEAMAVRSVARRAHWPDSLPQTPRELRQWLKTTVVSLDLQTQEAAASQQLQGLLMAYVTQHLSQAGIGLELSGRTEPDLTGDLTRILWWDFRLALLNWLRSQNAQLRPPDPPAVIAFFEHREARTESLCCGLLNRLHVWLIDQYSWR